MDRETSFLDGLRGDYERPWTVSREKHMQILCYVALNEVSIDLHEMGVFTTCTKTLYVYELRSPNVTDDFTVLWFLELKRLD